MQDLIDLRVARFWGLKPWEFRALTPERSAELAAAYQVEMDIESYYSSEQMKRMQKTK